MRNILDKRKTQLSIIVLVFVIHLIGCDAKPVLKIYIEDKTLFVIGSKVDKDKPNLIFPRDMQDKLEEEWKIKRVNEKKKSQIIISIKENKWNSKSTSDENIIKIKLSESVIIPVVEPKDSRNDISLEILKDAKFPQNLSLKGINDLGNNVRGLSVNGFYPGDINYPLINYEEIIFDYGSATFPGSLKKRHVKEKENIIAFSTKAESLLKSMLFVPPQEEVLWIAASGDIMTSRGVDKLLLTESGAEKVFGSLLPILRNCDLTLGNLEGAVTTGGTKIEKSYNFKFNPVVLPALLNSGFDYMMITNNHSFDYGITGFMDTMKNLKKSGMAYSGAGKNEIEAAKPWITKIKNKKVSIYSIGSYPPESSGFDGAKTAAGLNTAGTLWTNEKHLNLLQQNISSNNADYCIVLVHGGYEYHDKPSSSQIKLYRQFIDMGADIVFGSHPHVLQGFETYKNGLIFYSLGNFLFPGFDAIPFANDTMLPCVGLYQDRPLYIKFYPAQVNGRTVNLAEGEIGKRILKRFYNLEIR